MLRGALPAGLLADPEPFDDLPPELSLAECFAKRTKGHPVVGDVVTLGPVTLVARATSADKVTKVGLKMDSSQNV